MFENYFDIENSLETETKSKYTTVQIHKRGEN